MKISQKRTCEGCRAMNDGQGLRLDCELGYENQKYVPHSKIYPREPCPKPKTITEYFEAVQDFRKSI